MRALLGGKGANLAEMTRDRAAGARRLHDHDRGLRRDLRRGRHAAGRAWTRRSPTHLAALEERTGKRARRPRTTRCWSRCAPARSFSMPGMMDTILNLGLNDAAVDGPGASSGDERFAWDSYRRFVQMFGEVVAGVDGHLFEER